MTIVPSAGPEPKEAAYPVPPERRMERAFLSLLLALAFVITGCATRPGPEVLASVDAPAEGTDVVTVYAVTTREREKDGVNRFTTARARQTSYAQFTISLPPGHRPGRIEWPKGRPDPARSFVVLDQKAFSERDFLDSVTTWSGLGRRDVSVFVHGYNQNFQQALFRLAQMTADGQDEGAAVLFAWPSQAEVTGYVADRDSAAYSRDHLVDMLTTLAGDRRVGEIVLVAHSMGAWLTVEALRQLRLTGRDAVIDRLHVVLASPDIDVDVFHAQMKVVGPMKPPLMVLASPDDRALLVSKRLAGERDRVGALDITDPRVQEAARQANIALVDISSLDPSDSLRHDRFALLGSVYAQLQQAGAVSPGQRFQQAGAFVFNTVGATLSSPFILVGGALAGE